MPEKFKKISAKVSTLLTIVEQPKQPFSVGKYFLILGSPLNPSKDSIKAVSAPQTYAPAPNSILILKLKFSFAEWYRFEPNIIKVFSKLKQCYIQQTKEGQIDIIY